VGVDQLQSTEDDALVLHQRNFYRNAPQIAAAYDRPSGALSEVLRNVIYKLHSCGACPSSFASSKTRVAADPSRTGLIAWVIEACRRE
jgi:hypothetical protein